MFFNESELLEFKQGISGQFTVGNLERYRGDDLRVHIIANTIGLYISMFGRELTKQDGLLDTRF